MEDNTRNSEKTEERRNKKILILLFFGVLMGALDIAIVGPALASIGKTVGENERNLSWVFTIFVLFNLICSPVMAKLSDAIGRRFSYVLSLIVFGIGSLVVSLSYSFEILLAGRAIQGAGASGIFPVASAIIGDVFPQEKRGRALGLIGAVFGIAFIIGPVLAGLLLVFDWHWLFIINIPIAIILIMYSHKLLPNDKRSDHFKIDWPGIIVLTALLTFFTFAINNIDTKDFINSVISYRVLPLLIAFAILIGVFRFVEFRRSSPVINLRLFRSKQIKLVSIIAIGTGLFETSLVFLPKYAISSFQVSISQASFMLLPVIAAMAIASPVSGRMLDRFGSKMIVMTGASLVTVGLYSLSQLSASILMFYISESVIGLGLSMLLGASLRYILLNEVKYNDRTSVQGLLTIFVSTGQMTGAAGAGAVIASHGGNQNAYQLAYLLAAFVALLILVISFFLKNRISELDTVKQNNEKINQ
jgi:EmrB/QacA subfamily drug resistance transporter